MTKTSIGAVPCLFPIPIVLVGTIVDGRPNYATVGDCAVMGIRPALVAVSLGEGHFTTRGVLEHRAFSVNLPTTDQLPLVDYFGTVSGRDVDKSQLLASEPGCLKGVPLARDCPVNIECCVLHDLVVEHRRLFIAEVVETHLDVTLVADGPGGTRIPDLRSMDPIVYSLDNRYYRIGLPIGTGYAEGLRFGVRRAPSAS